MMKKSAHGYPSYFLPRPFVSSLFTIIIFFFLFSLHPAQLLAESVVNDLSTEEPAGNSELFTEKILRISHSKKIFLITDEAKKLAAGDFISILKNDQLISRALVAKNANQVNAIKIMKIYSLKQWNNLGPSSQVQILKGDDSYYQNTKKDSKKKTDTDKELEEGGSIVTEEDLYSSTKLEDDSLDDKGKRAIKTDNIIGVCYGQMSAVGASSSSQKYTQFGGHWAYQVTDNMWAEIYYGQSTLKGFPSEDLDTSVTNFTIRGKYTITAPMFIYVMPYVGFQVLKASSPNAGKQKDDGSIAQSQLDSENELMGQLQKNSVIFGATILKRLVPGWFVKADLGTDILNVGFAIEF